MMCRRTAGLAVMGLVLFGMAGCDEGAPPSGSRAIVPADHLEQQRVKMEQLKATMKVRLSSKPGTQR
jgi:hypothetical protein